MSVKDSRVEEAAPEQTYIIGDSTQELPKMQSESFRLVVTSPPYWNAKNYGEEQIGFGQSYSQYVNSLNNVWKECIRLLMPNGKIAIDIQPLPISTSQTGIGRSSIADIMNDVVDFMQDNGMHISNLFIWDKRKYNNQRIFGSYPFPPNLYSHVAFEFIYVFRKPGDPPKVSPEIKEKSKLSLKEWEHWCFNSIWDIPPVIKISSKGELVGHLAPFPLEIPRRLIRLFTFVGDKVLDPFLGSGTTLAACKLENRAGVGVEIQRQYEPMIKAFLERPRSPPSIELAKEKRTEQELTFWT